MKFEPKYFCTLFDSRYLLKGVAMLKSLSRYCPEGKVFVLCMDSQTMEVMEKINFDFVTCIELKNIEDDELLVVKKNRGVAEYCWTLSPCLPWYVLQNHIEVDFITYLDADLLFYSPVEPLFEEIAGASIGIIEHRFTPRLKGLEVNGRFCVEWVSFRRDAEGMACLARWREQCLEWCYYRLEDGRMGDQKYLDEWPNLYSHCHVIQHLGAGVAPWNYAQYQFSCDVNGKIFVENQPLIFYHFHQFQLLNNGSFDRLSRFYTDEQREPDMIYDIYEKVLNEIIEEVRYYSPNFNKGLMSPYPILLRRLMQEYMPHYIKNWIRIVIRF